ncbi:hypothetical protein FG386_000199 [Cryptosporidium ryanae]|uniref:uncharacterized protein n=1 Tax=Cryptosporidium ryanae TaxID=515981 RepID=UPI003519E251|nr:hypothetical protein FG386_000199 [Cryptosporidium ryanae]
MDAVNDSDVIDLLRKSRRGRAKRGTKVNGENDSTQVVKKGSKKGRKSTSKVRMDSGSDDTNDFHSDSQPSSPEEDKSITLNKDKQDFDKNSAEDIGYNEQEKDDGSMNNESEVSASDDEPEFEREAKLAEEYESRNVDKRKYELLYKNRKSPTSKQDSALLRLRNARKRKSRGGRMSLSDKESELFEDGESGSEYEDGVERDNDYDSEERDEDEEDEDEDEEDDDEDNEYNDGKDDNRSRIGRMGRKEKSKRYSSKRKSANRSDLDEYEEGEYKDGYLDECDGVSDIKDGELSNRGKKRVRGEKSNSSSLFEEDQYVQEKMIKRCERILDSINMKLMKSVHLTRDRILFMLEHPKFTEYICGSYVKVPIMNPTTKKETFLICEIFDSYIDDNNECILILQRGGSKKEWSISSISNNVFTNEDLIEWKAMIKEFYSSDPDYIFSLPTTLQEKAKILNGFQYNDEDIALILEKKQKESNKPNLSGKVLIENRTNLQTQIKQIELQLKNIDLDNDERKTKLNKIDELQKELEYTINEIEKLRMHKEMLHPDKSLKIVSTRYIGGVQGKGTCSSHMTEPNMMQTSPATSSLLQGSDSIINKNENEDMETENCNNGLIYDAEEKNMPSYMLMRLIFEQINSIELSPYNPFLQKKNISEDKNKNKKINVDGVSNNVTNNSENVDYDKSSIKNVSVNIVNNTNSLSSSKINSTITVNQRNIGNNLSESDGFPASKVGNEVPKYSPQDNEHQFGRRECRPSVMWETKRSKIIASNLQEQVNSLEQKTSQQREQQRQRELMQKQQQRKIKLQQMHHSKNNSIPKLKPYNPNCSTALKKLQSVPGRNEEPNIYDIGIYNYNIETEAEMMSSCFKEFISSDGDVSNNKTDYVLPPSYSIEQKEFIERSFVGLKSDGNVKHIPFCLFLNSISCSISN